MRKHLFYCMCYVSALIGLQYSVLAEGLPLFYWQEEPFVNFGDYISLKLVERIVKTPVHCYRKHPLPYEKKLLGIGSILVFARENDVVWGSGLNGKCLQKEDYHFEHLDVRAVRGPLTRDFLQKHFHIHCPTIYGDPALLFPYFFPEFKKKKYPSRPYVVIPHYSEQLLFPKHIIKNVIYPTEPWYRIIETILDSHFVISSSLHGIIIAEAFGIPARLLRVTDNEPLLKYQDYYLGTHRPTFQYATSIEEALQMGGEKPFKCDLQKLYKAFPFEYWPHTSFKNFILNSTYDNK